MQRLNQLGGKILVINLVEDVKKRRLMSNLLSVNDPIFVDGINGVELFRSEPSSASHWLKPRQGRPVHLGYFGCALSHLKCYKFIVDNNLRNTIIMEDDCVKGRGVDLFDPSTVVAGHGITWLGFNNRNVKYDELLSRYHPDTPTVRVTADDPVVKSSPKHYLHGSNAYIVEDAEVALRLISTYEQKALVPDALICKAMFSWGRPIFVPSPQLFPQRIYDSTCVRLNGYHPLNR